MVCLNKPDLSIRKTTFLLSISLGLVLSRLANFCFLRQGYPWWRGGLQQSCCSLISILRLGTERVSSFPV